MSERPIIFSAPMVRAILDGRKTQTRRVMKPQRGARVFKDCPFGVPGDRMWVRETWRPDDHDFARRGGHDCPIAWHIDYKATYTGRTDNLRICNPPDKDREKYAKMFGTCETHGGCDPRWRPSIHMPKWAARIWLEVEKVRCERLQDISEDDAVDEGVLPIDIEGPSPNEPHLSWMLGFREAWDSIHAKKPENQWSANPWVWAVSFEVER